MPMDERLKRLIAKREQSAKNREQLLAKRKAIADLATEEAREDFTPEEDTEFRQITAQIKTSDEDLRALDERISELSEESAREEQVTAGAMAVRRAQARVQSVTEGRTYEAGNGRSYLQDLMRVQMSMDGDGGSIERLRRHAQDVETDKEYRDLLRTDGNGGYFVPPLWMMQQYVALARAGAPTRTCAPPRPCRRAPTASTSPRSPPAPAPRSRPRTTPGSRRPT
jgi:hypothetical protein